MMKVGLVTLPLTYNIGGILQAYSLVEICKSKGWSPYLITRRRSRKNNLTQLLVLLKWKGVNFLSIIANKLSISFLNSYPLIATQAFKSKYIPNYNKIFFSDELVSKWTKNHAVDRFICGSDQIWNPTSFPSLRFAFAQFNTLKDTKRIAFAASLGHALNRFTPTESKQIANYLQTFTSVSCREDSGVKLISNLTDKSVDLIPDPTFVIDKRKYVSLASAASFNYPNNLLFVYLLDPSAKDCEFISSLAIKYNLNPISFFPSNYKSIFFRRYKFLKRYGIRVVNSPSPENWIRGVMNANLVITDSFHGTVFSLIFNTPFFSLVNENRGSARFDSLKSIFEIDSAFISPSEDYSTYHKIPRLNWENINQKISELTISAQEFLDKSFT